MVSVQIPNKWELQVGGLQLTLESKRNDFKINIPKNYRRFLVSQETSCKKQTGVVSNLFLTIDNKNLVPNSSLNPVVRNRIWELYDDPQGRFVFTLAELTPRPWIVIDPNFQRGQVYFEIGASLGTRLYPLQYLDMVIFTNMLANFGDLIFHASGAALNDRGYCFLGASGAGKSTLAADLARAPGVTLLGEDQVILRYQEGRFWIYGTPWHEREDRCSPLGVPLEKLFFLKRDAPQPLSGIARAQGVVQIMQTAFIPYYRSDRLDNILARLDQLAAKIPFFSLAYRRGSDLVTALENA